MRFTVRQLTAIVGFWLVVGWIYVAGGWFAALNNGTPFGGGNILRTLLVWLTWAPASLAVIPLVRAVPVRRSNWWYTVPVHTISAALVSLVLCFVVSTFSRIMPFLFAPREVEYLTQVRNMFVNSVAQDGMIYLTLLVAVLAYDASKRAAAARLRAAELDRQLATARLQTLAMQIRPHFLANSLQTISALIEQGKSEEASEMTGSLGTMFRRMLESSDGNEILLHQEIEFLESYLAIEKSRFRDRLFINIDIADDARRAQVPQMILQPIVENAIRHGFEPTGRPGTVSISAERVGDQLVLQVRDDGDGFAALVGDGSTESHEGGIGLSNTASRLEAMYGPDGHTFSVSRDVGGSGTVVTLGFPFRREAQSG